MKTKNELLMEDPIGFTNSALQEKYANKPSISVNEAKLLMDKYALEVGNEVIKQCLSWIVKGAPINIIKRDISEIDLNKFIK